MPIRVLVGPLLVALASWCAAGLITVPDPDRAAVRLALPAPWWVPVSAFLIALAIPAWRRHPMTAVPARSSASHPPVAPGRIPPYTPLQVFFLERLAHLVALCYHARHEPSFLPHRELLHYALR